MWSDNETNRDFLNFTIVADTAAEMIVQAQGRPLSIGVSGSWGVGKSTMIQLIRASLGDRAERKFLFVDFNAWLYQGYDDSRAALMDVIASALLAHAEETQTGLDKAKKFFARVNWFRAASLATTATIAATTGGAHLPLLGLWHAGQAFFGGGGAQALLGEGADVTKLGKEGAELAKKGGDLLKAPEAPVSPPQEIQELRNYFEETLEEMQVSLIVFVDDLDRCLPTTTIATLEAIRLFLFLKNAAFIMAADEKMIRQAVRYHFRDVEIDSSLVTNYFDKLIQVPLRVPPLGTQEVRAYMMLLFIENSGLTPEKRDELRKAVCKQLGAAWQGKRVDRAFIAALIEDCPADLTAQLELVDRLAPIMTKAKDIGGNPRLIKRFLNTLSIRMALARPLGITINEPALAKLLLLERCEKEPVYAQLLNAINNDEEGKPRFLKPWEEAATQGLDPIPGILPDWDTPFIREWLALPPAFGDLDLRGAVYVSREHLPIITAADQLSSDAAEFLAALVETKQGVSPALVERARPLSKHNVGLMLDRLVERAMQVEEWGTPPVLAQLLTLVEAHPDQASRLVALLGRITPQQLKPALIPMIVSYEWSWPLLDAWRANKDVSKTVKGAIDAQRKS